MLKVGDKIRITTIKGDKDLWNGRAVSEGYVYDVIHVLNTCFYFETISPFESWMCHFEDDPDFEYEIYETIDEQNRWYDCYKLTPEGLEKENYKVNRHKEICEKLNEIYKKKNNDYNDSFGKSYKEYGMSMPCIRLEDKLQRLKALTVNNKKQMVNDEGIEDTLMDLANYAIMSLIEIESEK